MARILIVDDDEMERLLLRSVLEEDHELFFAPNGRVAQEVVRKEPVDLIVTDLAMPDVNGLRLIKDLRAQGETMPIIAISGAAPEQLDLAQDYGAGIVLFKPIHRRQFLDAVRRCLEDRPTWDVWGPRA